MKIYILNITLFEDDYKHRYDSGVYPEPTEVFKSIYELNKRLKELFIDWFNEYIYDGLDHEERDEYIKKYPDIIKYNEKKGEIVYKDPDIHIDKLTDLIDESTKGGYVDKLWDYEISENKI